MIKIGDKIRFKQKYCARYWYSPSTYTVKFVDDTDLDRIELLLDEYYFVENEYSLDKVLIEYIELDVQATRMAKLKRIFND